jgi:ectoine hydroxylase-related dioxygenase (phytanoyl-CoA dioxygenase family)
MLTQKQIDDYRRDGYLVIPRLIQGEQLAELRALTDRIVAEARGVTENDELYDLEPSHTAALPRVRRLKPVIFKRYAFFHALVREPRIVAILQQLLGPSVRLYGGKLNMKSASYGSPVEWHQDWAFYPHTNDDLLAVGVMLDDCTVENGAMLVLPGTHKGPVHDHHAEGYFCGAIDPSKVALDWGAAVPVTGRAGAMSFHHVRLVHGSAQNVSDRPRALLLYEFAAADAWPLSGVADLAAFDAKLVAGAPTIEPRLAPVPVRMPLPPAPRQGSIYENQTTARNRFFAFQQEDAVV